MNNELPVPNSNNSVAKFLPEPEKEFENDLAYARQNVQTLIEYGLNGVSQLADLADQSQQSVAYERLSGLLKTVSDLNKDLVDIGKTKKEAKNPDAGQSNDGNTTNNLFVGSTAEMAALLAEMKKRQA